MKSSSVGLTHSPLIEPEPSWQKHLMAGAMTSMGKVVPSAVAELASYRAKLSVILKNLVSNSVLGTKAPARVGPKGTVIPYGFRFYGGLTAPADS